MKLTYILLFLPFLAFGQAPSPISNTHIIVYPGYGKLAEIKPDLEYKVPFAKKEDYKEIVFHRSQYDTSAGYELVFTLKKKTTTPVPVIVDQIVDSEKGTSYSSNWQYHGGTTAAGWRDNTIAFSNVSGSTAAFIFQGFKIEIYAERKASHGVGYISIDGGPEVEVKFNTAPYGVPVLVYTWTAPTQVNAAHTVVLKVGTGYSLLDFYKVFKVQ